MSKNNWLLSVKSVADNVYVRIIISVVLIGVVFYKVDLSMFAAALFSPMMLPAVGIAVFFNTANIFILSYRWAALLFQKPTLKQFASFVKATYAGAFYSTIFPTNNGGDFIKWTLLQDTGFSRSKLFVSVFIDRFVGILGLFLIGILALCSAVVLHVYEPPIDVVFFITMPAVSLVLLFIFIQLGFALPRHFPEWLRQKYLQLLSYNHVLRKLVLISIFSQFISCLCYWLLGVYWGVGNEMAYIFVFFPLISVLLLLPISIGGLGYKEVIFIYFFSQVGLSAEHALLISTAVTISKIIIASIGWLFAVPPVLTSKKVR